MRVVICLALLSCMGVGAASAQRRDRDRGREMRFMEAPIQFGVRGGYDFDAEVGSAGAQVGIPLVRQFLVVPSADIYFGKDNGAADPQWQVNADAVLAPDEFGGIYVGAGAALLDHDFDFDGDTEVEAGYNLLAGMNGGPVFDTPLRPFVEARWSWVDEYHPFRVVAGVNVPVQ